jgi:predicted RND superfamily exporter protein
MIKFGKAIVKLRLPILILAIVLLIPSSLGAIHTRINYDMLTYLPKTMDTVKGQDILLDEFGKGAFAFIEVDNMDAKNVAALKDKIEKVKHVDTVVWYDSISDLSIPMKMLPDKIYNAFNNDKATVMAVFFDTSTSADETIHAVQTIRHISKNQCYIAGMSALVTDLKEICEREEPVYVGLAVLLACIVMMLTMDSFVIPFLFLASIGMAILYNLGSNYFMGEISYVTKALSSVLQLAVTMDYSIFLWHSYSEQKIRYDNDKERAMSHAIKATITSVTGSSITTVAGFIALCFMSFTIGADLGIVMAKGVVFGVISCITVLPALILTFDKLIEKAKHRPLVPQMHKMAAGITKRPWLFLIIFVLLIAPSYYGYAKTNDQVYYDLSTGLPKDIKYLIATKKLQKNFDLATTHMALVHTSTSSKDIRNMLDQMKKVDGVKNVFGLESVIDPTVPDELIPDSVKDILKSNHWELLLINTEYKVATDQCNAQIDQLNSILKSYDKKGMLIGEGPCTKDMIDTTDHDFKVVNIISIVSIFIIILLVTKSISLPFILVAVIELAVFINLGLPSYCGTKLPFIAPICISTIQLGSTVDYAILMTTRYKRERYSGLDKTSAITKSLAVSMPSIIVSALSFFAATFGVGRYADVDIISSMCNLLSRGAIISMLCVIFILPALFMLLDKVICATSIGFLNKNIVKEEAK